MRRWYFSPMIVILAVNIMGWALIYHRIDKFLQQFPPKSLESVRFSTADIADKLTGIQTQLTLLQSPENSSVQGSATSNPPDQLSDLLPDIPDSNPAASLHYLDVSEGFPDPVRIYKEHADFSPAIGQLVPGQKYPFSDHLNGWYLVTLSGHQTGWVQSARVHEIL